jgi:hypothetical protein
MMDDWVFPAGGMENFWYEGSMNGKGLDLMQLSCYKVAWPYARDETECKGKSSWPQVKFKCKSTWPLSISGTSLWAQIFVTPCSSNSKGKGTWPHEIQKRHCPKCKGAWPHAAKKIYIPNSPLSQEEGQHRNQCSFAMAWFVSCSLMQGNTYTIKLTLRS